MADHVAVSPTDATPEPKNEASMSLTPSSEMDGSSFEQLMKERTRIRKEREEYSVAELRLRITRLEQALTGEIKRRVSTLNELEQKSQSEIAQMEERLGQVLKQSAEQSQQRLDSMEERLKALEERFEKECTEQQNSIETKSKSLESKVAELKDMVELERKQRGQREQVFELQLKSHKDEFGQRWATEQQQRQDALQQMNTTLDDQERARKKEQASWQTRVQEEMALLQAELQSEAKERQTQDEEIVTALNRYTMDLKKSLAILSGN